MFVRWVGFTASAGELRAMIGFRSWLTSTSGGATRSSSTPDEPPPPPHAASRRASSMAPATTLVFDFFALMRPPGPIPPRWAERYRSRRKADVRAAYLGGVRWPPAERGGNGDDDL